MGRTLPTLAARAAPLAAPAVQIEALARAISPCRLTASLDAAGLVPLLPSGLRVLQVNVGKRCNQTCRHCHVDAGPDRTEVMTRETLEQCLAVLDREPIETVDITGGAPELHPEFRWFVREARRRGRNVIDRCNLTIIETRPHRDLAEFLAEHGVELVCSLPHYGESGTDGQRGAGVFATSIAALRQLNAVGYGMGSPGLRLVLVTNPIDATVARDQTTLEREWKRELLERHGVTFDALYALTNLPIGRYLEGLVESGDLVHYMNTLANSFNACAAKRVMCRDTISVGWDGTLYDCDFNQMLELPVRVPGPHISQFNARALGAREIVVGSHCLGCTAGAGSSCGGALA